MRESQTVNSMKTIVTLTKDDIWALLKYGHLHGSNKTLIELAFHNGYEENKKGLLSVCEYMEK